MTKLDEPNRYGITRRQLRKATHARAEQYQFIAKRLDVLEGSISSEYSVGRLQYLYDIEGVRVSFFDIVKAETRA